MSSARWTKEQETAISLAGSNILVSAAAGAGKTSVLVERVIRQVLAEDKPLDLERLLVVTFTEKAAAEMKQRIRAALESAAERVPGDPRITRQLALLDRAQISTIHAFCLRVLRRYFFRVDLDPSFRVLDANEAELLRLDAITELFEELYDDPGQQGEILRALALSFGGRGIDEGLRSILLELHDYARTQPSFDGFLKEAKERAAGSDMSWLGVLTDQALADIERAKALTLEAEALCCMPNGPEAYLPALRDDMALYTAAEGLLRTLQEVSGSGQPGEIARIAAAVAHEVESASFSRLSPAKKCDPALKEQASDLRGMAKKAFGAVAEYAFVRPLESVRKEMDEVAPLVAGLCDLAIELDRRYTEKKRDKGGVDFSDLERYCLEILEKDGGNLARDVRREFDCVLIDEYQDTNPLQERILNLVSRQSEGLGNVFMVGDLKQSIYRFRLAEPRLFLEKYRSYGVVNCAAGGGGQEPRTPGVRVDLTHNFRSRPEVLDAVNAIFSEVMSERVADIEYKEGHELKAGAAYPQEPQAFRAEVHLVERLGADVQDEDGDGAGEAEQGERSDAGDLEEYEALEKEALVVAARIQEMVDPKKPLMLWDSKAQSARPCSYRDIAILMRSTKDRANAVTEVLARCDIPCYSEAGTGYFQAREVEVALSLLSVIDNPIQDIPLAAVLRSAIVGLEPKDLAAIRAFHKSGSFYDAVKAFAGCHDNAPSIVSSGVSSGASPVASSGAPSVASQAPSEAGDIPFSPEVQATLRQFLADLERWRTMARRRPLAEVLWSILTETGYHDYVGGLPGGGQRQANLRALCDRAREFDSYGRHGLFRFLKFIEKLQESQGDLGTARALGEHEDVVRLMSIHKSKGLEFPVVFVMDLGKKFNKDDVRRDVLLHRDLGVGTMYLDRDNRVKYPTALHQAIAVKIEHENLAEEMRVLYVALTRAKEKLVMVGSARDLQKRMARWSRIDAANADTYLDWICPVALGSDAASPLFDVKTWGTPGGERIPAPSPRALSRSDLVWDDICNLLPPPPSLPGVYEEVKRRLEWRYPLSALSAVRAKMSVGELKRRLDGDDEEAWRFIPRPTRRMGMEKSKDYSSAVERGIAVHTLLSRIRLEQCHSEEAVAAESARLLGEGFIQSPGVDPVDIARVAAFFASPAGIAMRECAGMVRRELPFTMRVPASLFTEGGADHIARGDADAGQSTGTLNGNAMNADTVLGETVTADTVIVQGVIDVLLDEPDGLTILDYKTDDIPEADILARAGTYTPQVALYALAAARIYGRPVKKASIIFLTLNREVEVDWQGYLESRGLPLDSRNLA